MTGRVILIRHGPTSLNERRVIIGWDDPPLTADTIKFLQGEGFRAKLLSWGVNCAGCIYSSDLRRATQTSEAIARILLLTTEPVSSFRERNFGTLTGNTLEEARGTFPNFDRILTSWNCAPPYGEDNTELLKRVLLELGRVNRLTPESADIAIVSHFDPISVLTAILQVGDIRRAEFIKHDFLDAIFATRAGIMELCRNMH